MPDLPGTRRLTAVEQHVELPPSRWVSWVVGLLLAVLVVLGVHWFALFKDHQRQLQGAQESVQLRAAQIAHAMALQSRMLVSDIDYMLRTLAESWVRNGASAALDMVREMEATLPSGALVQATVADHEGYLQLGTLMEDGIPEQPVYIGDREHFTVHVGAVAPRLHVSVPVVGRTSQQWSVLFSRPVLRNGRLDGVVYLAISPEYLSNALHEILPDPGDVALLARNDGYYLARSHGLSKVLGKQAPDKLAFVSNADIASATGKVTSVIDGVTRLYAYHRLDDYPLTMVVGLNAGAALAVTHDAIRASHTENAVGSALLLIMMLLTAGFFAQSERAAAALAQSQESLDLALAGGDLAAWDWDVRSGKLEVNARWATMRGYTPGEEEVTVETWERLIHPADWPAVHAALQNHLQGNTLQYESEHRMRHRNGGWVWVLDRGKVSARLPDGSPQRVVGTFLDVTGRRLADELAREAGERLNKLVAQVPGVVYQYLLRPDGSSSFPYASPGMRAIYGLSQEQAQVSAEQVFERIYADDLGRVTASIKQSAETLQQWSCEYRVCDPDGSVRWVLGQANPERLEDGATLWHGYIRDVTEQHLAADSLRQSEERLRLTLDAVRDGLWVWHIQTGEMAWDARCFEMLGYAANSFETRFEVWSKMLHPSDRRRLTAYLREFFANGSDQLARLELRARSASGEWLWVEVRGRVVAWADGKPLRMVGISADVGERVTERQLRDVLLERSAAAIFIASADRHVLSANARARELFGRLGEDLTGMDLRRLHLDEDHYMGLRPYLSALSRTGHVSVEYPMRDVEGRTRWFDMHGVLRDPERDDSDVVWTLFDVTDRHLAEAALKTERLRLTTLLDRFPGGVLMEDAADVVVVVNQGFCDLFGLEGGAAGLVGTSHAQLRQRLGAEREDWLHEPRSEVGREHRRSVEIQAPGDRVLEIDWVPITNEGLPLGRVWLVRDISERKQRESELEALASTDALTGLPNRRSFLERLDRAVLEARQWPVGDGAVLMFDIDHFKHVNDTWGHAIGDVVLQHVASVIRENLRHKDVPGRLGGEEFVALLPDGSIDEARQLAERVRERLEQTPAVTDAGPVAVTISIGVANLDGSSKQQVLERVDAAMYAAKTGGRNRVCVSELPAA